MLPIPVPIIGSNKRLFIPLLYILVTASICYLFLIALVGFSNNNRNIQGYRFSKHFKREGQTFGKYKREIDIKLVLEESSSPLTNLEKANLNPTESSPTDSSLRQKKGKKKRKKEKDKKLEENNSTGQNGTRRSYSTEIRSGYQDRDESVDTNAPYYQPWLEDEQCKAFHINFAKKETFKPLALVSFPGSGNSWLRYLIECSTGFFTGSVYDDKSIYSSGLLGEFRPPNDGSTIVQKTHQDTTYLSSDRSRQAYVKLTELMFGYRGILLVRNPYDALVSYWNFIYTRDHKGHAIQYNFADFKWTKFVTESTPRWSSLIISWVENSQKLLIVQYEKLQKNPRGELIRILHFLDQPVNESRLDCLLKTEHIEGPFHRHHNDSFNPHSTSITSHSGSNGSETKDKNFFDFLEDPGWNSKSWRNREQLFSTTSSFTVDQNISPNNNRYYHLPSLDLIIQDNIVKINRLFRQKGIPNLLEYPGPSVSQPCSST